MPFQCASKEPHSVCRCCCGFDNCNGPEVACLKSPPSCDRPEAPINGYVICPSFLTAGATCQYRCRYGYQLEGADKTQCELLGAGLTWSNEPPVCIVKPCEPLIPPEAGSMSCTDEWNIGSECTFDCEAGRVLVGREILKCSIFATWDHPVPECRVVTCFPPRPLDPQFVPPRGECTDGYNYLSTCRFTCHPDYFMIGEDEITCGPPIGSNDRATWDRRPPKCQIRTCEPEYCPNNEVGETCTFDCEQCQRLVGNSEISCTREGWTGLPGVCETITCGDPPRILANGGMTCSSDDNNCGDSCQYFCDTGYRLVGSSRTRCGESGEWSVTTAPICELSECDLIVLPGIIVSCTNGNIVGSECTLSCDGENREFMGEEQVRCKKDPTDPRPVWNSPLDQYCRFILCDNFPNSGESPQPDVGSITCGAPALRVDDDRDRRSGWRTGAQCNIQCNVNYQAKNLVEQTICNRDGDWTQSTLCCVECLINPLLDIVVFLDKTEEDVWDSRLTFLPEFIDFVTFNYGFNLNITFIPFGEDIDYASSMDFMIIDDDRNTLENFDFLKEHFEGISLAEGEDSNSGKALKEAIDNIFGFHNYRVPMVFLVTGRQPSDLNLARRTAQELHDNNIHLRILPITGPLSANAGRNRNVLQSLVEEDVYLIEGSEDEDRSTDFYILAGERLISVTQRVCNERSQALQPCLFA